MNKESNIAYHEKIQGIHFDFRYNKYNANRIKFNMMLTNPAMINE
jgi:hypothetical protein